MANVPHSTLTGTNLHYNMGDSRSGRDWTLAAGTTDALRIENSTGDELLTIDSSVTPGSTLITIGNATDDPAVDIIGTLRVLGATSGGTFLDVATNAGTDHPLRVVAAAANGPHTVWLSEAWARLDEVAAAPTNAAGTTYLYAVDVAGTSVLRFMRDNGTTVDISSAGGSGDFVGPASSTDNAVVRFDGITGKLGQDSVVTISDTGAIAGSTGYSQTSGNLSVTGNGTFTLGDGGISTINIVPGAGGLNVAMLDDDSANFRVQQGSDYYIRCDTTNASEKVTIGGVSPATMDVDITAGDDITIFPSNDLDIQLSGGGTSATAFRVRDGLSLSDVYLSVDTTTDLVTIGLAAGNVSVLGTTLLMASAATDNLFIGNGSHGTGGSRSMAIGHAATCSTSDQTAIGNAASCSGSAAGVAVGRSAVAGASCTAVGFSATTSGRTASISLGRGATSTANNQMVVGSDGFGITDAYIGQGVTDAAPDATVTINATGGSGTDIAPSWLRLAAGKGTGSATGSLLALATASPGSTGTTLQTLTDRVLIGGSATTTTMLIGNPDADNTVTTPVTQVTIAGTDGNSSGNASALTIRAGNNTQGSGSGAGGAVVISAGSTLGTSTGVGGDITLSAGNSGAGSGGTIRLQTGQTSTPTDRLTIEPNGAVQFVYQGATSMPVHFVERYRYTHNSASQTVLTYAVPSGGSCWVDVRAIWRRTAATTGAAIATVFGGAWNDGGTTDEIGGAAFTSTMVARSGQATADAVDITVVGSNATDEVQIILTKANANDYTVDLYVTVHQTS